MRPWNHAGYELFLAGAAALAQVEANGIRIDVARLHETLRATSASIIDMEATIRGTDEFKIWGRKYGTTANLGSKEQLANVLVCMGYHDAIHGTARGGISADADSLEGIEGVFADTLRKYYKYQKLEGTYLKGLLSQIEGETLHPFFNLHTTKTMRSSSTDPNFQNMPIRDPDIGRLLRSLFIPRNGRRLVEIDYSAIEVRVAACYHRDPTMIQYIVDGYDMHRDMGAECYMIPPGEVPKSVRQQAKALFVFAQFYGDYYLSCAKSLWAAIDKHELKTKGGVSLKDHLAQNGITSLGPCDPNAKHTIPGTFENHIKNVEKNFWGKRFAIYDAWRKMIYASYLKNGYVDTLTGFRLVGLMARNDVINHPVQGSAFHCLLDSLIEIQRELRRRKMRALIVGQIHDSIVADVPDEEAAEYYALATEIMTTKLRAKWPWLIVPLAVEIEACEPGGTWYDKKPVLAV